MLRMDEKSEFYVPPEDRVRRITFGTKPNKDAPSWHTLDGYDDPVIGDDLWITGLGSMRPFVLTLIAISDMPDGGFQITGDVGENEYAIIMELFDDWS